MILTVDRREPGREGHCREVAIDTSKRERIRILYLQLSHLPDHIGVVRRFPVLPIFFPQLLYEYLCTFLILPSCVASS